jgi:hypothetical protein
MTHQQIEAMDRVLLRVGLGNIEAFHHGDCVGADAEAHAIALERSLRIYLHPPDVDAKRAFCPEASFTFAPRPYLERNRAIVNACRVLIAAPSQSAEVLRSGTWATVRYARRTRRLHIYILEPLGMARAEYADFLETF